MCPLFFIKFLFFHRMVAHQKLWKMFFISSKKLFLFSRYSNFCNFSLPFQTFQIQKGKRKRNNLWCHELVCINLQMKLKLILKRQWKKSVATVRPQKHNEIQWYQLNTCRLSKTLMNLHRRKNKFDSTT